MAHETKNYNIQVLGLIETRWNVAGQTKLTTGEHIIYSGHEGEDHAHTWSGNNGNTKCHERLHGVEPGVSKNHYSKIQVNW